MAPSLCAGRVQIGPRRRGGVPRQGDTLNRRTLISTSTLGLATLAVAAGSLVAPHLGRADDAHGPTAADITALKRENLALRHQLAIAGRASAASARTAPSRSGSVDHALTIAAATYGVSKARLRAVATCESTLNPMAANGPYVGLFQFGMPLWRSTPYGKLSRTDPYAAALAAAKTFREGGARHWPVCGR